MVPKKDIELIKELEVELKRFQQKFEEYKSRVARTMLDGYPYRIKERAALKRSAEDLKHVLYKINKLSE